MSLKRPLPAANPNEQGTNSDSSGSSFICEKCKLISCLTERIIELEVCIRNLEKSRNSERSLDSQLEAPDASGRVSAPSTPAAEPSQRGEWVASRRHRGKAKANAEAKAKANAEAKAKAKAEAKAKANTEAKAKEKAKAGPFKHRSSPVHVSNRFSLLGEKPVEKPVERALVTGDSILPHVKIASPLGAPVAVSCIPGAGAPDIRGNLKMLAIEITKANIKEKNKSVPTLCQGLSRTGVGIRGSLCSARCCEQMLQFSTSWLMWTDNPGYHTDCLALALHLTIPWWPL
ncbi:hypothetical protein NFI96_006747 [Prochilodus magdalenae]|nr:hypothetical protein NFI96_006747 [Prochilodus magdalenae]